MRVNVLGSAVLRALLRVVWIFNFAFAARHIMKYFAGGRRLLRFFLFYESEFSGKRKKIIFSVKQSEEEKNV